MEPQPLEGVVRNVDMRLAERTRRHFDVVAERLEGHIHLIAEGQVRLQERFEDLRTDLKADIAQLDRRVMRLEAAR